MYHVCPFDDRIDGKAFESLDEAKAYINERINHVKPCRVKRDHRAGPMTFDIHHPVSNMVIAIIINPDEV